MAAGILSEPLNHEDVMKVTDRIKPKFENVVKIALKMF
jgi:purine-nucleoside phosphorylase